MINGVAWGLVERMMIDAPSVDISDGEEEIALTESNSQQIMDFVNSMM